MGLPEVRLSPLVVVLARSPRPGGCKTRLIPALGAEGAAGLARALLDHTLDVVEESGLPWRLALDGPPEPTLAARLRGRGVRPLAQPPGDLGQRLRWACGLAERTVCVGTDCPGLQAEDLRRAAAAREPCLGPADDGGYYLIAISKNDTGVFQNVFIDIPWSTEKVFEITLQRMREAGRAPLLLPTRADLDTPSDLARLRRDPACPSALLALLGDPLPASPRASPPPEP